VQISLSAQEALVRKTFAFLAFSLLAILPRSVNAQQTTIRVNCGGGSYKDSHGHVWQSDTGFTGGTDEHWTQTVAGTTDPLLYEDDRWDPTSYLFKVPDGQYHVNLYFAESAPRAQFVGARVFNISLQGTRAFANLDIFAEVGGSAALIKTANVKVTNGVVAVGFAHVAGFLPKISAIEILPGAAPPTLTMNFKYPDGTPVLGKLNYAVTSSLMSFSGAAVLLNGRAEAVLFSNPSALGISAQFTVNLNLTDSAGHQLWKLTVGLNPSGVNLTDVQSSMLNVIVRKQ
jgi:hypothetical protein